jgi:hypothetical protein
MLESQVVGLITGLLGEMSGLTVKEVFSAVC